LSGRLSLNDGVMIAFTTPFEVQLGLGLALLISLAIGWVARGWGERYERRRENRKIEKAGVWRCEDRGYYLRMAKEGGVVRPPGPLDQVVVEQEQARGVNVHPFTAATDQGGESRQPDSSNTSESIPPTPGKSRSPARSKSNVEANGQTRVRANP